MSMRKALFQCVVILIIFLSGIEATMSQVNGLYREVWNEISGQRINDLETNPKYPDSPDVEQVWQEGFKMPVDVAEFYGQRVRGYVIPDITGPYTFWVSGDDECALYLSTDEDATKAKLIASVPGWTSVEQWTKYPQQKSDAISLEKGKRYYIEALMKEHGGGDSLTVRWQKPGGQFESPIPNSALQPFIPAPPGIDTQPKDVNADEGFEALFVIGITKPSLVTIQWFKNGSSIAGADESELKIPVVELTDDRSKYHVQLTLPDGEKLTSDSATLTVNPDTSAPSVELVSNLGGLESVTLLFNERLNKSSAEKTTNYKIDNGIEVLSARLLDDQKTVFLEVSPMENGLRYILNVSGVQDGSAAQNTMIASAHNIGFDFDALGRRLITGAPESIGPSTRISGLIISEIMYNAPLSSNGKDLEFLEIYNSEEWEVDLSGYRLSGEVSFVFPPNTSVGKRSYLVIAKDPDALKEEYNLTRVLGPWQGSLGNGGGRIRLRNTIDAIIQEIEYSDITPWPASADGSGHSLVMTKPSYGENDPRAWSQSDIIGGTPGKPEVYRNRQTDNLVINEIFTNSPDPDPDFVELFNYSNGPVDISNLILTDNALEHKFRIPVGTILPGKEHIVITEADLGFALNSGGERIYLIEADASRVIDAYRYRGQPLGVSLGRYPDGSDHWVQLSAPSSDSTNKVPRSGAVVINEIMYNPITRDNNDEYIELYNQSSNRIDLSFWRIRGDVSFTFPAGAFVDAGGYVVIAENRDSLIEKYESLNDGNTFGNYNGALSNSKGELRLQKPEPREVIAPDGSTVEQTIYVVEDELTFVDGGSWPDDADARGSSLELIRSDSDNSLASNWAASLESDKSEWKEYTWTGRLDNGRNTPNELQLILLGSGECLVDEIKVTQGSTQNTVRNPNFEDGLQNWIIQGNHIQSKLSSRQDGSDGNPALHLIASSGGDNGANRIEVDLTRNLAINRDATISAKLRWLKGNPGILLRLYGNYGELSAEMELPSQLGTPGQANSQAATNTAPSISEVTHYPILPAARRDVTIQARVEDQDSIGNLEVHYRVFPDTEYESIAMEYRGAGYYTAEIPGQTSGKRVGFYIEARDGHENAMTQYFPGNSLEENGIIRFGERNSAGTFGNYHIWIGDENNVEWRTRAKLSNEVLPVTFVYSDERVIYNATGRYRGSPFIRPGYQRPDNSSAMGMIYRFPSDDLILGTDKVNLDGLEPGRDDTSQREKASFWIGEQLGVSFSYQRYIRLFVNGTRKSDVYTDSMQPDSDYIEKWYPSETNGDLYKIDDWFEFSDGSSPGRQFNDDAELTPFRTTGGALKQTAYRWKWEKKPNGGLNDDYSTLLELVATMNTGGSGYTTAVDQLVDVDQWMRVFATRHIVGDWDGYGYNRGKNQSAYKPENGKWKMLLWDLDFSLGGGSNGPSTSMYNVNDPTIATFYRNPPFERAYLRAWQDAVDGPLGRAAIREQTSNVYNGLRANGIFPTAPNNLNSWVDSRRSYLESQLRPHNTSLAYTTNNGNSFSTADNVVELRGRAPVKIKDVLFNGTPYRVDWTSPTAFIARIPLLPGQNQIELSGLDSSGTLIPGMSDSIRINYTGSAVDPADFVVINEIHYDGLGSGLSFLELYNRSDEHTFNLGGMRLNGLGYTFQPGSVIPPEGFVLLASNAASLGNVIDPGVVIFDEFDGNLDNDGETITLFGPADPGESGDVIDEVKYTSQFPWPVEAAGKGPSLQLISPELDNRRPANWFASQGNGATGSTNSVMQFSQTWKYNQSGNNLGTSWRQPGFNDASWSEGAALLFVESASLPEPKRTPLTRGPLTFYFRTEIEVESPEEANLFYNTILDDGAVIYVNGQEIARPGMPNGNITSSTTASRTVGDASVEGPFSIPRNVLRKGTNHIAVEVHQTNSGSSDVVWGMSIENRQPGSRPFTPGQPNSGAPSAPDLPPVWINELHLGLNQPSNDSWMEILNAGTASLNLENFYVSDNPIDLKKWGFPDGAQLDGNTFGALGFGGQIFLGTPNTWTIPFSISTDRPIIYLSKEDEGGLVVVDFIDFSRIFPGRSFGSFPDGDPIHRVAMIEDTLLGPNTISSPEVQIFFTEWMASNSTSFLDPVDKEFPDWFEIYNAGSDPVDLSGYILTDRDTALDKFRIPSGVVIEPKSYMVFIADSDPDQYIPGSYVHTNFRLSSTNGESLILLNPAGIIIDRIDFGPQQTDVSQGREELSTDSAIVLYPRATPGGANDGSDMTPEGPVISAVLAAVPNAIEIQWDSEAGISYQILGTTNIVDPNWQLIEEVIGNGNSMSRTIQTTESANFIIIRIVP